MSAIIYFLADFYPWWGIPLALILAELANYHRRHGNRPKMIRFGAMAVLLMGLGVAYFVFNGVEKMRPAIQHLEKTFFS